MKIIYNRENCIGCGACVSACPDHWVMGGGGKAILKDSKEKGGKKVKEIEEEGCNRKAAESCPVEVIKITES